MLLPTPIDAALARPGHPLYTHPRVQLTPHTCAISPQQRDALLAKVLRGIQALENGAAPADPVDLVRGD